MHAGHVDTCDYVMEVPNEHTSPRSILYYLALIKTRPKYRKILCTKYLVDNIMYKILK